MMILINIIIFAVLSISLFINWAFIYRFIKYDAEFLWDVTDPNDVKPLLKIDFDKVEDMKYFVVKTTKVVKKDKEKKDE